MAKTSGGRGGKKGKSKEKPGGGRGGVSGPRRPEADVLGTFSGPLHGYCIWQWQGAKWVLKKISCEENHEPGPPPAENGTYEGECRRGTCVQRKATKKTPRR
jgi:hypothetical protein